ncbi:GDSL esterase/lipase At1g29670-like [Glycine soja]|uniref:GDSL esterase/lipase At1g29670-like n=1 Tax=Glycine soja TaxID=3848 RepID=UPI00103AEECB|nr:GDSL esterase/lipase At1g29670-like [Glycine soja]
MQTLSRFLLHLQSSLKKTFPDTSCSVQLLPGLNFLSLNLHCCTFSNSCRAWHPYDLFENENKVEPDTDEVDDDDLFAESSLMLTENDLLCCWDGLIGCTPKAISTHNTNGSCVEEMNNVAFMINAKLKSQVDQFNKFYADSKSIFINISKSIFINITSGSLDSSLGFTVANASCCPSSRTNGLCIPNQTPCENRTTYVFWDQFHPTEAANRIIAINSYNGSDPALTYPMDIKHLVQT